MTQSLKKTFPLFLLFMIGIITVSAQKVTHHYVTITQKEGKKVNGRLLAINDSSVVMEKNEGGKKPASINVVLLKNIDKIKVFNDDKSVALGVATTAAIIGNIVFALTVENGLTAVAIGTGGTLAIVALAAIIYDLSHPPLAKLIAGKNQINYKTVSETFKVYIEKPQPSPPQT